MKRPALVSKSFKTPKGCHVRYVQLRSDGALVGYDCGGGGGEGMIYPTPGGGHGNYPSALVKGVRSVKVPGAHVSGHGSDVGFELSPRHVTCSKRTSDTELACKVHTAEGGVLSGVRKRSLGGTRRRKR